MKLNTYSSEDYKNKLGLNFTQFDIDMSDIEKIFIDKPKVLSS